MADFEINLDTKPLAESVDTVSDNVNQVTGAVAAMQAAVITAEAHAAKNICDNVDNGFFILMSSQLSQKMAACSSQITSKLMVMKKFRNDIKLVQTTMQKDYQHICAQYLKIFRSLNKALETRVRELDQDAIKISDVQKRLFSRLKDDSSSVLLCNTDTQLTVQKSVTAKLKDKSVRALSSMANDVHSSINYNKQVEHILSEKKISSCSDSYIPVVVTETESLCTSGNMVKNIYAPQNTDCINPTTIKNQLYVSEFEWQSANENVFENVRNAFEQRCLESKLDSRIEKEMLRLFSQSTWQEPTTFASRGGES